MGEVPAVRLQTDEDLTRAGWAAWSRNSDGLLCTSHAPFETQREWVDYVNEETGRGYRVVYPPGALKFGRYP